MPDPWGLAGDLPASAEMKPDEGHKWFVTVREQRKGWVAGVSVLVDAMSAPWLGWRQSVPTPLH